MTLSLDTIAYYTECWSERLAHGHNVSSSAIHYGLDFRVDEPPEVAKARTNEHVLKRLQLDRNKTASIADFGCGAGSTTLHLARRAPAWRFVALDATPANLAIARARAHEASLNSRARFVECDYASVPFDGSFDGAYSVESLCHIDERERATREMARLLAARAPLVVVDFIRTSRPMAAGARRTYDALRRGFAIADYYDEPLEAVLKRSGFATISQVDLSGRIAEDVRRSAARARERMPFATTQRWKWHFEACIAVADMLEDGLLRYESTRAIRNVV